MIYPERVNRKYKLTTHNSGLNISNSQSNSGTKEHCSCFPSSLLSFRLVLHPWRILILLGLPSSQVFRKIQYTKILHLFSILPQHFTWCPVIRKNTSLWASFLAENYNCAFRSLFKALVSYFGFSLKFKNHQYSFLCSYLLVTNYTEKEYDL